ncbi:hypothetical protein PanWU01x14_347740 [Parasponia andersonii]|uniref:DUF506 family protein n=1 Tax=Parasponia andersonii TaxID=3476 RepID=A0A2P5ABW4_PARAD|nr:hypothetical protein PanWU01x14_347740 [Parasponia andersonii]
MARIPVRFHRVAAAFDEVARVRLCESSGSEHSVAESFTDLSNLVNSFIERGEAWDGDVDEQQIQGQDQHREYEGSDDDSWSDDQSEKKDMLRSLFGKNGEDDDDVKRKIYAEVESACEIGGGGREFQGFKRRLMTHLRDRGFDAGLCKSKWDKSKRFPAGDYEYVDVNVEGTRYIVEAFLVGEFEIARPTDQYTSLLEVFPMIFVGKVDELKQIVRLMSNAIRESMKSKDMPMPPWRRNGYMQTKWFGSYKRTTNPSPSRKARKPNEASDAKRSVGFESLMPTVPYFCRTHDFSTKVGLRVGNLTAAFNG